jgi:hypothetical protein
LNAITGHRAGVGGWLAGVIDFDVAGRTQSRIAVSLETVSLSRYEIAIGVDLKIARASHKGVSGNSVFYHEVTVALDREIAGDPGSVQGALLKVCRTAPVLTPEPIWMELGPPVACKFWLKESSKSARPLLKPNVSELAMLLPMTSS